MSGSSGGPSAVLSADDGLPQRPQPPFKLSRASKDIAFGSLAGMVSKVFEHPFDLVKVRLQTQPSDRPAMFKGAFDCFRQTYVKEGARGLFRGLSMPVFGATLENASLFFTYNFVQGQLRQYNGLSTPSSSSSLEEDAEKPLSMGYLAIAAACAGSVTSVVLTPVELIKCKMQVQMVAREVDILNMSSNAFTAGLDGPLTILKKVIRQDGIRGLWLGQTGTLLRETGGGVAWFLAFEYGCRTMIEAKRKAAPNSDTPITKKDLGTMQLIGAGALAGISYNVVLFPADSVKSTMQTEREWASSGMSGQTQFKQRGFLATLSNIYKTRGIRGLYAGCGVTCMRSAPSSALIFLLYNRLEALADDWGI
ncbi:mitochondrial carrier [Meira miltonrushii]|uniref:Mitochondrial carrier n=1 Tax=Meira miltonrushii TaxID=1280837 RepID=A0A316VPF2_9BASI|nr:mitochondrial carrier [Meira miltonrushii]PWN38021.1 mitochondrial carrier [Meira miltonrushii]